MLSPRVAFALSLAALVGSACAPGSAPSQQLIINNIGMPTSVTVDVANGSATVHWNPPASNAAVAGYTVGLYPTYNNRLPNLNLGPNGGLVTQKLDATRRSWQFRGLLEDCHQRYLIQVSAQTARGSGGWATTPSFRPSGIVVPGKTPPYVVILLDGIGESKPGFQMDPYAPTQDGTPSYCPESWSSPNGPEAEANFKGAPTGPWEFFNKWNFNATGSDSGDSKPLDYATGQETHSYMLDAIAAQGAIILPYGYRGVTVTRSNFTLNEYSKCNSTPSGGAPGVDLSGPSGPDPCVIDPGHDGDRQTIDADVGALQDEVSQVENAWPKTPIIIMGHSQGGLIAFEWWKLHGGDSVGKGVTNLFALDSPINGVCVVPTLIGCTLGPVTYPDYSKRKDADRDPADLSTDAQLGNPFRFIGTWGEKVVGYGGGNDTLQRQLLVTGDNCGDGTDNSACPSPPDHISGCPITGSNSWIIGPVNYHFVVKWCPDDVNYFNNTLGLQYFPAPTTPTPSPAATPASSAPGVTHLHRAYVTTGSGVVPINLATGTPLAPIPVPGALDIAITPDGKTAYVTTSNANATIGAVVPIDLATGTPGAPISIPYATSIAIAPDGKTAYVTLGDVGALGGIGVVPIDLATNTPETPISVPGRPENIAITPDSKTAYVRIFNGYGTPVVPIDLATSTSLTPIPVTGAIAIAITPNGKTAYVTTLGGPYQTNGAGTVVPIDLATNTPETPISVPGAGWIVITPDGKTAYVTTGYGNSVVPIDLATNVPQKPIGVGNYTSFLAIAPDGKTAYVTTYNGSGDSVVPVNLATNTPGKPIPVPNAGFIAITP